VEVPDVAPRNSQKSRRAPLIDVGGCSVCAIVANNCHVAASEHKRIPSPGQRSVLLLLLGAAALSNECTAVKAQGLHVCRTSIRHPIWKSESSNMPTLRPSQTASLEYQ
jgi:hypothetical protein